MLPPAPSTLGGSYEDLHDQAQMHLENDENEQALAIYQRIYDRLSKLKESLLDRRPDLRDLRDVSLEGTAILHRRMGNYEQSLATYQKLLDTSAAPEESRRVWQRSIAWIKLLSGDTDTGLDELRALAIADAGNYIIWMSLGMALYRQDEFEEAETSLKRALSLKPDDPEDHYSVWMGLFSIYEKQQRFAEAEDAWHNAWKTVDSEPATAFVMWKMHFKAGNLDRAEYWAKREKAAVSKNFYLGRVEQARGNTEKAQSLWKKAAGTKSSNRQAELDAWAEAALRVNFDPNQIVSEIQLAAASEDLLLYDLLLLAIAQIRAELVDSAHKTFQSVTGGEIAEGEVRETRLEAEMWDTFTELIIDAETQAAFSQYFVTEEA